LADDDFANFLADAFELRGGDLKSFIRLHSFSF
jgi:hypothetical protein